MNFNAFTTHASALLVALLLAGPAAAQTEPTLYERFGGQPGLQALTEDFVQRLASDPRIQRFFEQTNRPELAGKLAEQFCAALGGPCRYSGADMKTAHQDMGVGRADFNALVEDLQAAMRARGIPFTAQNQLLARLAPLHREVIEARP